MTVLDEITASVKELANTRPLPGKNKEAEAFGYWYLEQHEDLSEEDAEETIVGGPWDNGRDAVHFDEETKVLGIYQFKYSQDLAYVLKGFKDLQRGVEAEKTNLAKAEGLRLYLVTIASGNDELYAEQRRQQKLIKTWLTKNGFKKLSEDLELEVVDLKRFLQLSDKIVGVDLSLNFATSPVEREGALYGLVDAAGFKDHVDKDELLSFNIRKFLGIKKGSVNQQILASLKDDDKRSNFWKYNNGLVCLCTSHDPPQANGDDPAVVKFTNFTIVNGAQTVNTVSHFLKDNPLVQEPLYVMAKVVRVKEDDVPTARSLTSSSNTQTPATDKDLRALDPQHKRLAEWFAAEYGLTYVYRRGEKAPASGAVRMKELAQAYTAFWDGKPHVAFARPGSLFSDNGQYERVFPPKEIENLAMKENEEKRREFVLKLLVANDLLIGIRGFLAGHVQGKTEKELKWKSLSYHILWLINRMMESEGMLAPQELEVLRNANDEIVKHVVPKIYNATHDHLIKMEVPKVLKTKEVQEILGDSTFFDLTWMQEARKALKDAVT